MADKPYISSENVSRTLGRDAQRNNILAAKIIADIVKTTLGPKGMDKMLVDSTGNIIVTNDGVTILEEMEIDHPAAKMIVEIAKSQESEVGDGTTTVALLAGKLLENAERLLDKKIHPTTIIKGYKLSAEKAKSVLNDISFPVNDINILKKIAMTAMTGKGVESDREHFAEIIVKSIDTIGSQKEIQLNNIKIIKIKGEEVVKSELVQGLVLEKDVSNDAMPKKIEKAKIALIDFALELRNPETETKISISSPEQLDSFLNAEERMLREMTDKIIISGANVVFCQKGIDDVAQYYLAKANIMACRRVSRSDMEKLALASSGKIISNLKELAAAQFGYADNVEEIKKGDDALIYVQGCKNPKAVTILVRGTTSHVVDEVERALSDGLGVVSAAVREGKIVVGGGAVEIELAKRLREYSRTIGGKEQLAIEEFATALESIPEALAENAGMDPIMVIAELKKKHELGDYKDGLNLFTNKIENCFEAGIIEPLKIKTQAVASATEVATMILRIDDVLVSDKNAQPIGKESPYSGLD